MVGGFGELFEPKRMVVKENTVLHMELNGEIGDYTYADFNSSSFQLIKKFGTVTDLKNDFINDYFGYPQCGKWCQC